MTRLERSPTPSAGRAPAPSRSERVSAAPARAPITALAGLVERRPRGHGVGGAVGELAQSVVETADPVAQSGRHFDPRILDVFLERRREVEGIQRSLDSRAL